MPGKGKALPAEDGADQTSLALTQDELLSFLGAIELRDPIHPGETTVDGFAQLRGISRTVAERALRSEVKAGRMTRRVASLDGKFGYAYSVKR